ncbi:hypothetical protein [Streptomyces sp. NRRL S-1868]|uniref:hypothetical protein n=1 Tax=Streptomyces sp. NRRL S-1868 TaxID=1463892 RepID=UPI0004C4B937|nr:hypothetical protein [Streptomyces sp. NRRL S-1868]
MWSTPAAAAQANATIAALKQVTTRKATAMTEHTEQYPWDSDHDEAANFARLVQAGITPKEIVAALGRDAEGMGRYRKLNGRSRRWIDTMLTEVKLAADNAAAHERARATQDLATERQVSYILDLLAKRRRSGEGGGFLTGPTTRAGIAKMSRSEASAYIDSLKGDY